MECCGICYDPLCNGEDESSFLNDEGNDKTTEPVLGNAIAVRHRWNGCLAVPKLQFCNECIFQYLQVNN